MLVLESGLDRRSTHDFESLHSAKVYADDCASETEHGPVYSSIYDDRGREVYRGRHYGMRVGALIRGFGAGLRREHYAFLESGEPHSIDWFEAISENYMDTSGRPRRMLELVRRDFPVALHGVSMSIGRASGLNQDYLKRLKELVKAVEPGIVSDHVCWTGLSHNLHDLLPLPFTEESLSIVCEHVMRVQELLGRQILLENVSSYLQFSGSQMREWEFLDALAEKTGCGILLDVNNVYVSAQNHGLDALAFIQGIHPRHIGQMHLAGHTDMGEFLFDTHSAPVHNEVWTLFAVAAGRRPDAPVLIEWDEDIPDFRRLEKEVNLARHHAGAQ